MDNTVSMRIGKGLMSMMTIMNKERYRRYRAASNSAGRGLVHELWLPALLFGSMGAITWAIRGTDGWGGIDGTLVPGLTWGLLWYYLCYRKGVDARGIVLWLGLGLALGGELGYGQYVAWIRGMFYAGDDIIPISPWLGYAWFAVCGVGWAAPGGIMLGWALHPGVSVRGWFARALLVVILLVMLFNLPLPLLGGGFVSRMGQLFAQYCPGLLFPHARLGLYASTLDQHLGRTVYTNTQNFMVLVWWLMALCLAAWQRDRATLVSGAALGCGFGIGFALSAIWCLGYNYAPAWIDWWKMWELHAGFNLGLVYALVLFWALQRLDKTRAPDKTPPAASGTFAVPESGRTLFLALAGFVLVFAAGVEYFFWTGLFLALFFAVAMSVIACLGADRAVELRKRISLSYCAFLLVFMLFHGGVSRTGVFLELYAAGAVDQYAWPAGRIALFAPVATVLVVVTTATMIKQYRIPAAMPVRPKRLPERMIDLFAFIGLVGAVSIWPEKIGVLYALFLCLALFSFTRINRCLEELEG